ncbi:acyl-CoA thioesterase-1 [Prosthecobacter fusiformis]|uniref:Acyl-CoA thioesterase-1 n=1 Tax=Prosthecobacter fusiformis TaxID=48464 RepID=A0A4R7RWH9_9BACT|nr:SGNH/GDSL hydrolase family protein [Prosthecobacter fusiformis]TDU69378.1 acyl-CoA thioesterase-1 [Prosthecobacter fusiformis]
MKRTCFLLSLAAATFALSTAQAAEKPRVLILGDSISIGYTPVVQKLLADEMTVLRPMAANGRPENCSDTKSGVLNIDRWLQIDGGKWNIIHFNWGLHDLKHMTADGKASDKATDPVNNTVEAYEKNLREIVAKLKATGAKLIFATTTPVPDEPMKVSRLNTDVIRYNEAALRVMKENGITVNDLYSFALPKLKDIQIQPANVHFTPAGSEALGAEVVKSLQATKYNTGSATYESVLRKIPQHNISITLQVNP